MRDIKGLLFFFQDYNKFDLPFPNHVNPIDIGIDITDVLRINDKVTHNTRFLLITTLVKVLFCRQGQLDFN